MTAPRLAVALAAVVLSTPNLAAPCFAQDYPARPIRIVVPFGAGGPADVAARLIGNNLQEKFGQPIVVENRTGAGGVIGTLEAAKSPPDGYTLLMMSNTQTANESLVRTATQIRLDARSRADCAGQLLRSCHRGAPAGRCENAAGIHRASQIAAGQIELRLLRSGYAVSHGRRTIQNNGRH